MRRSEAGARKRLANGYGSIAAIVMAGMLALAGQALAKKGPKNVKCEGTAPAVVKHDLIVPKGTTCTIAPGTTVGHDVKVEKEATLIDEGGEIRHDIQAKQPSGIGIGGGGSVRHNVSIDGTTGAGPGTSGTNFVCSSQVGHDLVIQHSSANAGEWVIGDSDPSLCSHGNRIGHDLRIQENENHVDVSDNNNPAKWAIGHDLDVQHNATGPVVESNTVRHDANCQADRTQDGDGTANTAGGKNTCG
jgi:hypothetical protein